QRGSYLRVRWGLPSAYPVFEYLVPSRGKAAAHPCGCAALLPSARRRRHQLDIEAERTHVLNEHIEAFRYAGFVRVVATHDGLVALRAAGHVVRLHCQHILKRVGGAVSLEGPPFHFAEPLPAELCFAAQRPLSNERIRADGACMDLVVHKMMQLQ